MKLLQILYPGLGGHSSVAFSLIEGDHDKSIKHQLLGYGIEEPSDMFLEKANSLGIQYSYIKKSRGFSFDSQLGVFRRLQKLKPEAVIMHSTSLIFVLLIYALFNKVNWLAVEHQSNHAKTKKDWLYTFFILLLAPKIVYLTDSYRNEIKAKYKLPFIDRKIRIISNGINTNLFKPKEVKIKSNEIILSMISRMTSLRDHRTLILAFNEFVKANNAKLYIAGEGPTLIEHQNLVKELGIKDRVVFTGILNENGVIDLLQKTDIYIHSSLAENLSTSILQAMASKVPIIATDIPGISNLLQDEEHALLFGEGNFNQLNDKLFQLVKDDEMAKKLVENSFNKIKKEYSNENMFINYMKYLNG